MSQAQPASSLAGSFRMFRVFGISVYVHWSWLLVAGLELRLRTNHYSSQVWNIAEYLSLFVIVLLHEFGHALACRQVGGRADEIVLWPLGGIAFVNPPARPGAVLWSIAAGPLVNLALVPVTIVAYLLADVPEIDLDLYRFLWSLLVMNLGLFIFNMLPIFPLDGGQILQAILWFFIGRAKSLKIASMIGLAASVVSLGLAIWLLDFWIGLLAVFAAMRCWTGIRQAEALKLLEQAPRHHDAACPSCQARPPVGPFWFCPNCRVTFDPFMHMATCPNCGTRFPETQCLECQTAHPLMQWYQPAKPAPVSEDHNPEPRW